MNENYQWKFLDSTHFFAILPIELEVEGHTIIISKSHFEKFTDIPLEFMKDFGDLVIRLSLVFQKIGYNDYNLLSANGRSAQQSVNHFHMHYFPRKENDNIDAWPQLIKSKWNRDDVLKKIKNVV